ncbi:uncharacterized protein J3D65DRAFT_388578 [Phyllosticta citribraziliensis]|uniref:Uncharacterized protein n=1 Tax=Phyllosticta citribraziliensis TaxID=989973 RepID=A0ABR1LMM0_9PEZI
MRAAWMDAFSLSGCLRWLSHLSSAPSPHLPIHLETVCIIDSRAVHIRLLLHDMHTSIYTYTPCLTYVFPFLFPSRTLAKLHPGVSGPPVCLACSSTCVRAHNSRGICDDSPTCIAFALIRFPGVRFGSASSFPFAAILPLAVSACRLFRWLTRRVRYLIQHYIDQPI